MSIKIKLAIILITVIVGSALAAPLITSYSPTEIQKGKQFLAPSTIHYFGTDEFGRDVFSRTIYAGRISLLAGFVAVVISAAIGVPLGLISGYYGKLTDTLIMRTMDSLLAFPALLLALTIVAILGPSSINAMIAVSVVSIPDFARISRASILAQKEKDYVQSAISIGASHKRVIFSDIFPNCVGPILVQITIAIAFAILLEAALSFLGLGTQPPEASWGAMLFSGRGYLRQAWWYAFFPGLFITLMILTLNIISEYIRDKLDPITVNS